MSRVGREERKRERERGRKHLGRAKIPIILTGDRSATARATQRSFPVLPICYSGGG